MPHSDLLMNRLTTALALVSTGLIGFQLVLMQLLSVVQWYHFAYMVISVALLGFGAAGTVLSLARGWFLRRFHMVVPLAMIGCGAAMPLAAWLAASEHAVARFDSYLLFVDPGQFGSLILTYLLFFIPFFLGALAIGLILVRYSREAGTYYFANLLGSGVGALFALALMWVMKPVLLPPAVGLIAVAGGVLVIPRRYRRRLGTAGVTALLICVWFFLRPFELQQSQFKDLSKTLDLPDAEIVLERSSPYGLVQVVSAPALRHAPGLSLSYRGDIPVEKAVFNNGNWYGPVTAAADSVHLLDYSTSVLPYVVGRPRMVLDLHARTGSNVAQAVTHGAEAVTAVEPHESVLSLLRRELAPDTDSLLHHPAVTVRAEEPRTYLAATRDSFALITQPIVGAFGGTLGLFALREEYGLTVEAFGEMWRRLAADGMISVTSWMDYPYRNPMKLLATLVRMLRDAGVEAPENHLAAWRSWGTVTFVATRAPLGDEALTGIREAARELSFDPLLLPGLRPEERMRYNVLQDTNFFAYIDRIVAGDRGFIERYDFDIQPATDNDPYFSQFLKWKTVPRLFDEVGPESFPFLELGTLITAAAFVQIFFAAILLIILPLFRHGWARGGRVWTLLYFSGLGIGYLFLEMVLIQRFVLYLGHPIYAVAAVLAAILIFSGVGSSISQRLHVNPMSMATVAGAVALLIALYALFLMPVLRATISQPLLWKALLALMIVGAPAFLMGMPFPFGLRFLTQRRRSHVPWAWAINGCLSVVSSVLAALLAVQIGFVAVMLIAAGAYGVVAVISAAARGT
ncbi:MAG: hypothetical protein WD423_03100 [Rhodothermales bacterium]